MIRMEKCKCGKKTMKRSKYCKQCFMKIFEKRIRRELQKNPWFKKGEKVLILEDNSCKTDIIKQQVVPLIKTAKIPVKIGKKIISKGERIISPENLEDFIADFLKKILKNQTWKKDEIIRPLRQLTDTEIKQYAELKNLKKNKRKKDPILTFINKMEKEYPEIKFTLLKTSQQLFD